MLKRSFIILCSLNVLASTYSMSGTLFLKSDVEDTKIRRIVARHSSVDNIFSFCGKPLKKDLNCKIDFYVSPNEEQGDGVIIRANGVDLQLTWDYEDRFDFAPKPVESNGKYVLIRYDRPGQCGFHFVVVPKEKAEKLASQLIQNGEEDFSISQQVGISQKKIQELRKQQQ